MYFLNISRMHPLKWAPPARFKKCKVFEIFRGQLLKLIDYHTVPKIPEEVPLRLENK